MKGAGVGIGLFGAGAAILGLFAYSQINRASDEPLLVDLLTTHCLPYAQAETVPFREIGLRADADDMVILSDREIADADGLVVLERGDYEAAWGTFDSVTGVNRFCTVAARPDGEEFPGFFVEPEGFVARFTAAISPDGQLTPDLPALVDGPRSVTWSAEGAEPGTGLRVLIVADPGIVLRFVVVDDAEG